MNFYEGYAYETDANQKIVIVRYNGYEQKAVVPREIEGLPVCSIREHAFAATDIVEAEIPEGVEIIGAEAFGICEELQTVTLPESLKELGKSVFKGSDNLKQLVFPNGNSRYRIENGLLYDQSEQALVLCPPGLELEKVTIPLGIKTISCGAFYSNRQLEYVRLPLTLKKIETEAFLFTNSLRIIELPPYLEEIEPCCFLVSSGRFAEKQFDIYAFPDSVGYRYASENNIRVHPLYAIVTD